MEQKNLLLAKKWMGDTYFDQSDRDDIHELIESNQKDELNYRFYKELEFGTGGLR